MTYQAKLKLIINSSGLSQQALAVKIGVSTVSLNNWLNGKSKPTRKALIEKIDNLYLTHSNQHIENKRQRIKFYGLMDLATSFQSNKVIESILSFDDAASRDINDMLELYNLKLYIDHSALPNDTDGETLAMSKDVEAKITESLSIFFNKIDAKNAASIIKNIHFEYFDDLLLLLGKYKIYDKIDADTMLGCLRSNGIPVWSILRSQAIVKKYDAKIREILLAEPEYAEQIVSKYLMKDNRQKIHLPTSLTADDSRSLLNAYIESEEVNPNFLELIFNSRTKPEIGIDAKLKLHAKRKYEKWADSFFNDNQAKDLFKVEVRFSEDQEKPLVIDEEGQSTRFTYNAKLLRERKSSLAIINNFVNLFPFVNEHLILSLPSYASQLGVFERFLKVAGNSDYPVGAHFQFIDSSTFLQLVAYEKFLVSEEIRIEDVASWFFGDYLSESYSADGFIYSSSSSSASYFEKTSHVFQQIDGVIRQFSLYAKERYIDQGLLENSDPIRFHDIPSALDKKYAYIKDGQDIQLIMYHLFSDQSPLAYIDEQKKGGNFIELMQENNVVYSDFSDRSKAVIDELDRLQVVNKKTKRLTFVSREQISVLKDLFTYDAVSYHRYSMKEKDVIERMVKKRWLYLKSSLLTKPEASYLNYMLNKEEFGNGPELRNKYIHAAISKEDRSNEDKHYQAYIKALRILICLILKIDDDLYLSKKSRAK